MLATAGVVLAAIAMPYVPLGGYLGFEPLPVTFLAAMLTIVVTYAASAELMKYWFYRDSRPPRRL
jgi:Mg2+-importing ATPase